jgi:diguanylate cyclase (GGDEF)-like protein
VLSYLFIVAVADLALGFALAVALGRRWRALADARCWAGLSAFGVAGDDPAAGDASPGVSDPAAAAEPVPLPQSPCQQAIEALHQEVDHYGQQLSDADAQLRQYAASPDISGIEACLSRLDAASREHADHRDAAQRQLAGFMQDVPSGEETRRNLQVAAQLQDAEIKRTRQSIVHFDYDADPAGSCLRMVEQTQRLISAGDRLRDALDHTLADAIRQEHRGESAAAAAPADELTGCITRAGIEANLAARWQGDLAGRRLCAVMLDLDHLAQVNEQSGYRIGNGILGAIGRLLRAECPGEMDVARYTGQRFLLIFPGVGLQEATGRVERIRQIVENARFEHKDTNIRMTVSCSVTEALAEDTVPSLLERLEAALGESKRYGRNRTFAYEGRFPTPVVPPELEIEPKHMPL